MNTNFKYLFTPLQINSIQVRNRIFQTAHAKIYEDHVDNGAMTSERNAYYHAERAKGGAGLLVMEYQMVHPTSTGGLFNLSHAWRPEIIPRYNMVARMVHEHGGTIFFVKSVTWESMLGVTRSMITMNVGHHPRYGG